MPIPVEEIRGWIGDATSRLLGDTIGMSEAEWHSPSSLPGWSRAHVATHLARNADDFATIAADPDCHEAGKHDPDERFLILEDGADRSGMELQIDLDTSAGALDRAWREVDDWSRPIAIGGETHPLAVLPLIRLHEVAVHHLDLGLGTCVDDLPPEMAAWLLRWVLSRLAGTHGQAMTVTATSGTTATIGSGRVLRKVSGTDARLWAWLSGRAPADTVEGARGVTMELLA